MHAEIRMTRFDALEVAEWPSSAGLKSSSTLGPRSSQAPMVLVPLLNILSQHFGWTQRFIGTPRIDRRGAQRYFSGVISETAGTNVEVGKLS